MAQRYTSADRDRQIKEQMSSLENIEPGTLTAQEERERRRLLRLGEAALRSGSMSVKNSTVASINLFAEMAELGWV